MAPPVNIDAANAIDIGTVLPFNTTQDVHDAGTTYDVWYKYTAQAGDVAISIWGRAQNLVTDTYFPRTRAYSDAGITQITSARSVPLQLGVIPGNTYWFEFEKVTSGNPTPANLVIDILRGSVDAAQAGDIVSNDERTLSVVSPAAVLPPNQDYVQRRFIFPFAVGEGIDVLPQSGRYLVSDLVDSNLKLYDSDFNELATVALNIFTTRGIRANHGQNAFYVGDSGAIVAPNTIHKVDEDGNIVDTWTTTGSNTLGAIGVSNDGTIAYFATLGASAIKRWDLNTDSALADFQAAIAGYEASDILVLADDTILVLWFNFSTGNSLVRQFNAAGTQLNEYNFANSVGSTPSRLAYANDNPNSFWIRFFSNSEGLTTFRNVKISDGSTIQETNQVNFLTGAYNDLDIYSTGIAIADFGASLSCAFCIVPATAAVDGTLIVQKVTDPSPDADDTEFTIDEDVTPGQFTLKDGEEETFLNVTPGTYSVVEQANANYITTYAVSNDPSNDNTNIVVGADETVIVIITNTRKGSITVGKITDPFDDGENTFNFTADAPLSPTSFSLESDEEQEFTGLAPGTYSLRETQPEGFNPTYLFSNESTSPEAISVAAGEEVTVVVLNTLQADFATLYFIDPTRRNDRLLGQNGIPVQRKIPEPYYITAFLQDK